MFVGERMSHPIISIAPDMPVHDALDMFKRERIRRAPVVKEGKLVGIVSDKDLLNASPSMATSLSIWEMNYLLSKVTVSEVMTKKILTVSEDTPIEEAARIMADNKIGGLPVLREGKLVGIITETDLFMIFLELLGARERGVRLSVLVSNSPEGLVQLTKTIFDIGGNILALGTFLGESCDNREVTMKIAGVSTNVLTEAIEPFVERIVDIHEKLHFDELVPTP